MAELGRGVKAGVFAGAISGFVIITITSIIAYIFSKNKALITFSVIVLLFILVLMITIRFTTEGLVLGVIFSLLYRFIPTEKSTYKAIIFSLFIAAISIGALLIAQRFYPGALLKYAGIGNYSVYLIILILLVQALFRGYLLGYFWDKFGTAT